MTFRMFCARFMLAMSGYLTPGITLDEFIGRAPIELRDAWERGDDPIEVARGVIVEIHDRKGERDAKA